MGNKIITFGTKKVSASFKIVYPKEKPVEKYLAEELAKKIFELTEIQVKVENDGDSIREGYELCLGKTNRTTAVPESKNTYKITVGRYATEAISDTVFGYEDILTALASRMEEEGDVAFALGAGSAQKSL